MYDVVDSVRSFLYKCVKVHRVVKPCSIGLYKVAKLVWHDCVGPRGFVQVGLVHS